ncbi:conserved hypothetical protein [Arthrobacter sp. 9AX]|uniref:SHOCT domain-containing protein n=1 Tax=Arthrobacter sp. 9AX TaxID=2653131 RepID=UPI0012F26AC5|nr:SHOCT domain-containing protein [Arthrobacter sp. 9AX]VXB29984.1 conserved hypothetical protein [Arthrobacter sp. 9AX]
MNDHAVRRDAGAYFWEFGGRRPLRETARWVTGVSLAGAGAAIAIIGTASHTYLSIPLGIAVAVLGAIVLVLHLSARNRTRLVSAPGRTGKRRIKSLHVETATESVASELALLADLYSQGALTVEEFDAAKRRVLGI